MECRPTRGSPREVLQKRLTIEPTRNNRAELTETWVANLYAGLTESAPWWFAGANAAWLAERDGRPKPATMFGLKGLGQARKPKVALDRTQSGLVLRLEFSGGNLILPRASGPYPPTSHDRAPSSSVRLGAEARASCPLRWRP
jgi:hypothetical protein